MADTENPDYESRNPATDPQPPVTVPDSNKQDVFRKANSHHTKKDKEPTERRIREWLQLAINVILAVVGIVAIYIYFGQLSTMNQTLSEIKKQTPQIQEQATAAQGQLTQSRIDSVASGVTTAAQLGIFQGQLDEARRSRELSERQWKAQQRPWVGVSGNVEFPKPPVFQIFPSRPQPLTGIQLPVTFKIKNFGISPAFRTTSALQIKLSPDDKVTLPQDEMKGACSLADQPTESEGNFISPSVETTSSFDKQTYQPIELTKIRRVWILGCIVYQDATSNMIRHTKFWIASYYIQESNVPILVKQEIRGGETVTFLSLQIPGWNLLKTEAD